MKNVSKVVPLILFALMLQQCCSSRPTEDSLSKNGEQHMKQLPRGTIEATIKILEFSKDSPRICKAKVSKVHGYGAGVRPISEDVQYDFELSNNVIDSLSGKELVGKEFRCNIKVVNMRIDQTSNSKMKIISLEQ